MANTTYKGTGAVASADFKSVSWAGRTKDGKAVTIALSNAINLGDIDWTFAEKGDTVPSITFTACYSDASAGTTEEPWTITMDSTIGTGADEILLGAGVFSIGGTAIAATRGGGSFKVVREYRRINADGDRGAVKERIVCEGSEATLTMNVLEFIKSITSLYPGIVAST